MKRFSLTRADPLTKLAMSLIWIIALSLSQRLATFGWIAGLLLIQLVAIERMPIGKLLRALAPFAFFAATSSWIYALAPNRAYDMVAATGWAAAALVAARTMTIGLVTTLFATTTEPADLARALVARARVSPRFVYGALAAIQFLPALAEEARMARMTARAAAASGAPGWRRRARLFFAGLNPQLALVLLAGAVRRAGDAAISMELRGLGSGHAPSGWRVPRFARRDAVFACLAAAILAAAWIAGQGSSSVSQ